ncbi:hypothetical protein AGIG_G1735 [Arapaima gigas]
MEIHNCSLLLLRCSGVTMWGKRSAHVEVGGSLSVVFREGMKEVPPVTAEGEHRCWRVLRHVRSQDAAAEIQGRIHTSQHIQRICTTVH